ncbi:MAG: tol-pal system protein YbgF [Alphaproteobacteria bacterium]
MKPWRPSLCGLAVILALVSVARMAEAQSDPRDLQNRIDRLERDLAIMQRQAGRAGSAPAGAAPAGDASSAALVQMEGRIAALENSFRDLTGRLEEISFRLGQIDKRMEKQSSDVDFRLKSIEDGRGGVAAQGQPPPGARPQASDAKPSSDQGTIIIPTPPPGQAPAGGAKVATAQPGRAALPAGSPEEQFRYAFEFLNKNDYPQAERNLRAFAELHPTHALTGNAYFWLGQIAFVGKDYAKSAIDFASSYQKFPDGAKAPDSLVKLGISLANLGKKDDACAAFKQFASQYPGSPSSLKQNAASESGRLGCK